MVARVLTPRYRTIAAGLIALLVLALLGDAAPAKKGDPRRSAAPPGQLKVVTVNAKQHRTLDVARFKRLYELTRALRTRPAAFDGGFRGAVTTPDVIVLNEMSQSNAEIFKRLIKQQFNIDYELLSSNDRAVKMVFNTESLTLVDGPNIWNDVCADGRTDGLGEREYMWSRFTINATGGPVVMAGVHLSKHYVHAPGQDCMKDNVAEIHAQLDGQDAPVVLTGDFNRRAVTQYHECDPDERSDPLEWWSLMTGGGGGRSYADTVQLIHHERGLSMKEQWTHEQKTATLNCDSSSRLRRSRIDYIFASALTSIAEATADVPGWATAEPGVDNDTNFRYSDHRFVWARVVVAGPQRVARPSATPAAGGEVDLAWTPVEGATGYVVYRALRRHDYEVLAKVDGPQTSFADVTTENAKTYRYAIAAVAANTTVGFESRPARATADARGPHVTVVSPASGATGERSTSIEVRFDEGLKAASVDGRTIELFRGDRRVRGTVRLMASRLVRFNPASKLRAKRSYRVAVHPVRDRLGNLGGGYGWSFKTR